MNALTLLLLGLAWLLGGYFIYSKFLEKKIIKPNDKIKTPAKIYEKDPDFKPSKKYFLFGHHFASIAGAGPIIGPILAVSYFGWFFVVLWITIGSVFLGAIHDYFTLMLSVRHKGEGIAKLSKKITGNRIFYVLSILLWLTLMLIITVFSVSASESLIQVPELVIPFFGITFTAILLGMLVYKYNANKLASSIFAVLLTAFFIWLGVKFPVSLPFSESVIKIFWISALFVYCFIASMIPVWVLLQPRDYISAVSLFSFLSIGLVSILIARPVMNAPFYIANSSLPLWPILFITVACGAISGFHSLVASGTTSKQLEKESDGRVIGYGAMIAEGIVALLVVIFISAGLKWSTPVAAGNLGFFQNAFAQGWIVAFSNGFAEIVTSAFSMIPKTLIIVLGSLIVNIFILTSLDTSTRIGRMISSEMFPKKFILNKRFVMTLLILIPAFLLAITNSYATLWRMFGASNQLIAAVVLIIISAHLILNKKPVIYTILPSFFMIVTTIGALVYSLFNKNGYLFGGLNISLAIISVVLIIFAIIVFIEVLMKIIQKFKMRK